MRSFTLRQRHSVRAITALVIAVLMAASVVAVTLATSAGAGVGTATYSVTIVRPGTGTGSTRSTPAGIDCGPVCSAEFDLKTPVVLVADPDPGSRFKGWDGTIKGSSKRLEISPPSDGLPIEIEAIFEKAARPLVKLRGRSPGAIPFPRRLGLRLDCRADVPCRLRVKVLLGTRTSKKGYDYYQALSGVYNSPADGKPYRDVTLQWGKATPILYKRLNRSLGKRGVIRIVVKDLETGLGMAINQKACACERN